MPPVQHNRHGESDCALRTTRCAPLGHDAAAGLPPLASLITYITASTKTRDTVVRGRPGNIPGVHYFEVCAFCEGYNKRLLLLGTCTVAGVWGRPCLEIPASPLLLYQVLRRLRKPINGWGYGVDETD